MPTPLGSLTNLTATGDLVSGPGCPSKISKGLPIACLGDAVAGAACVGTITSSLATNKIFMGRPASDVTAVVTGVNPATGVPVSTTIVMSPSSNTLM